MYINGRKIYKENFVSLADNIFYLNEINSTLHFNVIEKYQETDDYKLFYSNLTKSFNIFLNNLEC
jgi:hypothetical protein